MIRLVQGADEDALEDAAPFGDGYMTGDMNASNNKQAFPEGDPANARLRTTHPRSVVGTAFRRR